MKHHAKVCNLASQDVYENVKQNIKISTGPVYVKMTPQSNSSITNREDEVNMSENVNLNQNVFEGNKSLARSSKFVLYSPG